ncbi:hypothetical protein [Nitratidesulfovibrio sp.]
MRYLLLAIIILTSALFTFVHAQNEVARGAAASAPLEATQDR